MSDANALTMHKHGINQKWGDVKLKFDFIGKEVNDVNNWCWLAEILQFQMIAWNLEYVWFI